MLRLSYTPYEHIVPPVQSSTHSTPNRHILCHRTLLYPITLSLIGPRGRYKCSKCGALKTNHNCPILEDYAADFTSQVSWFVERENKRMKERSS